MIEGVSQIIIALVYLLLYLEIEPLQLVWLLEIVQMELMETIIQNIANQIVKDQLLYFTLNL